MQQLRETTISRPTVAASDESANAATLLLEVMPPVMWFLRRNMRRSRTANLLVPQFRTLVLLDGNPTASLSTVAEHLGSSLPTASRIVSGLVARGFVSRKGNSTDRRQISLRLTKAGQAVLETARSATRAALAQRLNDLSDDEHATLAEALRLLGRTFASDASAGESTNANGNA